MPACLDAVTSLAAAASWLYSSPVLQPRRGPTALLPLGSWSWNVPGAVAAAASAAPAVASRASVGQCCMKSGSAATICSPAAAPRALRVETIACARSQGLSELLGPMRNHVIGGLSATPGRDASDGTERMGSTVVPDAPNAVAAAAPKASALPRTLTRIPVARTGVPPDKANLCPGYGLRALRASWKEGVEWPRRTGLITFKRVARGGRVRVGTSRCRLQAIARHFTERGIVACRADRRAALQPWRPGQETQARFSGTHVERLRAAGILSRAPRSGALASRRLSGRWLRSPIGARSGLGTSASSMTRPCGSCASTSEGSSSAAWPFRKARRLERPRDRHGDECSLISINPVRTRVG